LGASDKITEILSTEWMLPAVGQGALGIETRVEDRETSELVAALNDAETRSCVTAERSLLHELEGGCQVPLGAWARMENGELHIEARLLSPDGKECLPGELRGAAADAERIGLRLGKILKDAGAEKILRLAGRSVGRN
jgi:hydroxymethylbilane synthase